MMFRRSFLIAALAALALPFAAPAAHAQNPQAEAFVAGLADQAINAVAAKNLSEDERQRRFRDMFVATFDLPEIGKFVLGRYWRSATPEQQQEFLKLFEDINVLTWAKRFKDYSGERLQVTGSRPDEQGVLVDTQIIRQSAPPLPVQWRVKGEGDQFKVIDIVVEGVSMAITQRADYSGALQSQGGKMDGLLAVMKKKIEGLKAA